MASTPITAPPRQEGLTSSNSLEKKLQKKECLSRVLISIATLASLEVIALIICASLALISWSAAAIPIVIGLIIVAISLFLLNITLNKKKQLKGVLEYTEKPPIFPRQAPHTPSVPILPSFKDFTSILSSEDLKTMLFPPEKETSTDPATWFSKERLQEVFLKTWAPQFQVDDTTHYIDVSSRILLTLQTDNIATLHTAPSKTKCGAIVNSANATMSPERRWTNIPLSQAVTLESWENSKEGKARLNVSEVSAGRWTSKTPVTSNTLEPSYLFQALGPEAISHPIFYAYKALIQTYVNCFEKADLLKVSHLQLPLLSSAPFARPNRHWLIMAKLAFLAGVSVFLEKNPQSCLKEIILVGLGSPLKFN